eukprot:14665854-Heterocapsa_arctica.AAC.1
MAEIGIQRPGGIPRKPSRAPGRGRQGRAESEGSAEEGKDKAASGGLEPSRSSESHRRRRTLRPRRGTGRGRRRSRSVPGETCGVRAEREQMQDQVRTQAVSGQSGRKKNPRKKSARTAARTEEPRPHRE